MSAAPHIAASGRAYWFWMAPIVNPVRIIREVALRHDLTPEDLTGPSKRRPIAHARQEAMWELRDKTRLSSYQIAERLARQDHTTALHGVKAHAERMAERVAAE